mmetsp:Transcript_22487/g.73031  ORF Transcript_22487/g.73031 Transcript_22487/m.73031 type:complete len:760 (+) Transcript_22487:29-2308(+)
MALEVRRVINDAHEQQIMAAAYNRARKEVYSGGQDGLIKTWDADTGKLLRTLTCHKGWVTDLLFTSTAKLLFSSSVDGLVVVWSEKGRELQEVEFGGPVFCMAWNQKRKQLVAGGNCVIHIYRVNKLDGMGVNGNFTSSSAGELEGKEGMKVLKLMTSVKSHTDQVRGLCCSESGRIFSAGYDKAICMYDSERPKESCQRFEKCHEGAICSLAIDTDNNWLITGSYDGTVRIWSQEGRCLDVFEGMCDTVTGLCYVPSTKNYWITGKNRKLVAFDPRTPTNITQYIKETSQFDDYAIHKLHQAPGTDVVIGMTSARQLVIWRYNPFAAYRVLNAHRDWVEALVVVRRTEDPAPQLFSAGSDGLILRWQPNSELNTDLYTCQEEFAGHEGSILCIVYSDELDMLITGSEDQTIRLWPLGVVETEPEEGDLSILCGHEGRVTGLACCGEHVLASVSHDLSLRFWDLHTKHEMEVIAHAHDTPITCLEFSDMREELATCAAEPAVKVWCAFGKRLKYTLSGHAADVTQVKWCAFRACWVTGSDDDTIRLWDGDGNCLQTILHRGESVTTMHIDNANQLLLAAFIDRVIRVFDFSHHEGDGGLVNEHVQCKLTGHMDLVRAIAHVEEKDQYMSASWDKSIRVWFTPKLAGKESSAEAGGAAPNAAAATEEATDEETFVSAYEKEHPLVQPKALRSGAGFTLKLTKSIMTNGKDKSNADKEAENEKTAQTALGRRLNELEAKLAQRIYGDQHNGAKKRGGGRRR